MTFLWLYVLVILTAFIWMGADRNATGAFECLRSSFHETARELGMYAEFLRYSLGRLTFLVLLVILSGAAALLMFAENTSVWGQGIRAAVLAAMFTGSALLFPLPFLAARVRFLVLLFSMTNELADLVAMAESDSDLALHLDSADYDTCLDWSAWHPKQEDFERKEFWAGLVPAIYLKQGKHPALVVPIDWSRFLAWNLPREIQPGLPLPFSGPTNSEFHVTAIRKIPSRPGWSVAFAEMDEADLECSAA